MAGCEVVVIGAGMIGASCAYYAARAGLSVTVLDSAGVAGGTTSRGEGNILVSDKAPGPELVLAQESHRLWLEIGEDLGPETIELDRKGGLVVAATDADLIRLHDFARGQAAAGVHTRALDDAQVHEAEPFLAPDLPGGVEYPQDLQVQPMLAAASLLAAARSLGAQVRTGVEVTGVLVTTSGAVRGVRTTAGEIITGAVVNAAGTWGGQVSERLGAPVPVLPRRGFVLVSEPLPPIVRHKVYDADYVANVASGDAGLETSTVVEGTRAGTVLVGASRERVGFEPTFAPRVLARLARQAVRLFPVLSGVRMLRAYRGFRPYCPDHLPVIGADARLPGLLHACGHEGAGIGLAPATGRMIVDQITGATPTVDPEPYSPNRFAEIR
ncbi:MAG: NAD(P)/FAD-dependent oxidoreductase [Actinomycetales bacterium]